MDLVFAWSSCLALVALSSCGADNPGSVSVGRTEGGVAAPATSRPAPATSPPNAAPVDLALADGNDDEQPQSFQLPAHGLLEKVGAAPVALTRVCDLTAHQGKLYAAHANQPLGTDGAVISVYDPHDSQQPFRTAFNWNRAGEPAKGGGGGQGFLRVHRVAGDPNVPDAARLFVTDADPPYAGFGMADWGTEGFVYVSAADGTFARPRMPKHMPPLAPTREGKPGALVLPRAYHVIDAIRWRGAEWASTGSVPPSQRAWRDASPGALHRVSADFTKMIYAVDYPNPYRNGVWRLTFLVRFAGKLLAGIQDYDGVEPNDYVVVDCVSDDPATCPAGAKLTVTGKRVTESGTAQTVRWYADGHGRLYWITWNRDGVVVRVSTDAATWDVLSLPVGSGRPTDVIRTGGRLVVMAEGGLYATDAAKLVPTADDWTQIAAAPLPAGKKPKSPFVLDDLFCGAPLAVLDGTLYVGSQRSGALYKLVGSP